MAEAGGAAWKNGLFGCFGNCKTCLVTYVAPCYTFGKIAEKNGESCVKCGCFMFIPILNIISLTKMREATRESKGIPGSFCEDLLMSWFCTLCSLVQEAREVEADVPGIPEMERA